MGNLLKKLGFAIFWVFGPLITIAGIFIALISISPEAATSNAKGWIELLLASNFASFLRGSWGLPLAGILLSIGVILLWVRLYKLSSSQRSSRLLWRWTILTPLQEKIIGDIRAADTHPSKYPFASGFYNFEDVETEFDSAFGLLEDKVEILKAVGVIQKSDLPKRPNFEGDENQSARWYDARKKLEQYRIAVEIAIETDKEELKALWAKKEKK